MHDGAAPEALNEVEPAVQVDDAPAARALVQPVHVLGHEADDAARPLELRQREVSGVRARVANAGPAPQAAGPVAPARGRAAREIGERHRLRVLPGAVRVAVVGNPGRRAAAGARQHEDARVLVEEAGQGGRVVLGPGRLAHRSRV